MSGSSDSVLKTRALVVGWNADTTPIISENWGVVVGPDGSPVFDGENKPVIVDMATGERVSSDVLDKFYDDNAATYLNTAETTANFKSFVDGNNPGFVGNAVYNFPGTTDGSKTVNTSDASLANYDVNVLAADAAPAAVDATTGLEPFGYSHSYNGTNRPDAVVATLNPEHSDVNGNHINHMTKSPDQTNMAYVAPSQYGPWMAGYDTLKSDGLLFGDINGDATGTDDRDTNSKRWGSNYTKFWDGLTFDGSAPAAGTYQEFMNNRAASMTNSEYNFDGVSFGTDNINSFELFGYPEVLKQYLNSPALDHYLASPSYTHFAAQYAFDIANNSQHSGFGTMIGNNPIQSWIVQEAMSGYGLFGSNPDFDGYAKKYNVNENDLKAAIDSHRHDLVNWVAGQLVAQSPSTLTPEQAAVQADSIVSDQSKLSAVIDKYVVETMAKQGISAFDKEALIKSADDAAKSGGKTTREEYNNIWWPADGSNANGKVLVDALTNTLANSVVQQIEAAKAANKDAVISAHESLLPNVQDPAKREMLMQSVSSWQMDGSLLNMFSVELDGKGDLKSVTPKDGQLLSQAQLDFIKDVKAHNGDITVEPAANLSPELLGITQDQFNSLTPKQATAIEEALMKAFNSPDQYARFVSMANAQDAVAIVQPMRNQEGKIATDNIPAGDDKTAEGIEKNMVQAAADANAVQSNMDVFKQQFGDNAIMPTNYKAVSSNAITNGSQDLGNASPDAPAAPDGLAAVQPQNPAVPDVLGQGLQAAGNGVVQPGAQVLADGAQAALAGATAHVDLGDIVNGITGWIGKEASAAVNVATHPLGAVESVLSAFGIHWDINGDGNYGIPDATPAADTSVSNGKSNGGIGG